MLSPALRTLSLVLLAPLVAPAQDFRFHEDDRICLVGGAVAERMQHDGWLEARLQARYPKLKLTFRNLGFSADALKVRQRTQGFGSQDDWLERCKATVVFAFFGFNESFAGEPGLGRFRADLTDFVRHTTAQKYDGENNARIVLFTPIATEDVPSLRPGTARANNERLREYANVVASVANAEGTGFVELFEATRDAYARSDEQLTLNGTFLNSAGNEMLARQIDAALGSPFSSTPPARIESIRKAVVDKNEHWFQVYRTTDGYNVYGGRSAKRYAENISNYDVLQRELEIWEAMADNRDEAVHVAARGGSFRVNDANTPEPILVKTNIPGPNPDGSHDFLSGEEAISEMHVQEGVEVTLFADEARFEELVNPVQMSFDAQGRLWVAAWPTYTHWTPKDPRKDALLIFHDDDGDGRADRRTVFAGDLHNPTGFEFWNGGVIVAQVPDLLFLRDTDGDDVADERTRILHGISSGDTHHSANSFVFGPDGALYFQEGTFHMSQIETPYGPVRNRNGCVWRFEPDSWVVERYVPMNFANPHGHVFDRWGHDIVHDGTTAVPYFAATLSGKLTGAANKHPHGPPVYNRRVRPCGATEILSSRHFPESMQQNLLVANVIGFRGIQRYRIADDYLSAEEAEPLVYSDDENFRPVDIEVGPDGAVWFLDWHNPIIGHLQHHIRDPNRDNTHGRVYRVTVKDRPRSKPPSLDGMSVDRLIAQLESPEDRVRYRARLELTKHDFDPKRIADVLERLWACQRGDVVDFELLGEVLGHEEPRARAAAVRVLRHWTTPADTALSLLARAAADPSEVVRLEVVTAASFYEDPRAVEAAIKAADAGSNRYTEFTLKETLRELREVWVNALAAGQLFVDDSVRRNEMLGRLTLDELSNPSEKILENRATRRAWFLHMLGHPKGDDLTTQAAIREIEKVNFGIACRLIDAELRRLDAAPDQTLPRLASALSSCGSDNLRKQRDRWIRGIDLAKQDMTRRAYYAAVLAADRTATKILPFARRSLADSRAFLGALQWNDDEGILRSALPLVASLAERIPPEMVAEVGASNRHFARYVRVELPRSGTLTLAEVEVLDAGGKNVARGKTCKQSAIAWNGLASRAVDGNTSGRYGDNTSTHTPEGQPNPWWEVDLTEPALVEKIRIWNRTDGDFGRRLDGFTLSVLDAERNVLWSEEMIEAPKVDATFDISLDPSIALRVAALATLERIPGHDEAKLKAWRESLLQIEAAPDAQTIDPEVLALGEEVYRRDSHCVTCHQLNGEGLPNLYPPIVGTQWVLGSEERLIKLVLHGLWGELEVDGITYKSPPLPPMTPHKDILNDEEVAAVLTYVRNSWGNEAPTVSTETVKRVRAATKGRTMFWKPEELLKDHPLEK